MGVLTGLEPDLLEAATLGAFAHAGYAPDPEPRSFHDEDGLPYGYLVQSVTVEHEPETIQRLEVAVGRPLRNEAVVMAFTGDPRSRVRLAQLALRLATATHGWVDVDGDISRPYGRPEIPGLPNALGRSGRCLVIDSCYFLDVSAMEAWLRHPRFHVIK
jgi:hypothetical protein